MQLKYPLFIPLLRSTYVLSRNIYVCGYFVALKVNTPFANTKKTITKGVQKRGGLAKKLVKTPSSQFGTGLWKIQTSKNNYNNNGSPLSYII